MKRRLWLALVVLLVFVAGILIIDWRVPDQTVVAPVPEQEKWRLVGAAEQYLAEKLLPKTGQGQAFAAFDLFGVETAGDGMKTYGWCYAVELDRNQKMYTGISVPVVLDLKAANGDYQVVGHWLPSDGSEYWSSIQKQVPKQYLEAVRNRQGRVKDLEEQVQTKAKEYFSKKAS